MVSFRNKATTSAEQAAETVSELAVGLVTNTLEIEFGEQSHSLHPGREVRVELNVSLRLDRLYILGWQRSSSPTDVRKIPTDEVGIALMPLLKTEPADPVSLQQPSPAKLSELLTEVDCYQVTGGVNIPELVEGI